MTPPPPALPTREAARQALAELHRQLGFSDAGGGPVVSLAGTRSLLAIAEWAVSLEAASDAEVDGAVLAAVMMAREGMPGLSARYAWRECERRTLPPWTPAAADREHAREGEGRGE